MRLLARQVTWHKAWNLLKIRASFQWSRWTRNARIWGLPYSLSVEPTTSCNLRCPECPSGLRNFTRPTGMLDPEWFYRQLKYWKNHLLYMSFYFQGEPYLHPEFTGMVRQAVRAGCYTVTSTNANYLDEQRARETVASGLHKLIISLDGTTQEVYEQYRKGGRLDKVLEGIRHMVRAREAAGSNTPLLVIQFLVVRPNEHQVSEVKALGKKLGVDHVQIKTAQIYDYENGHPLIPENPRYARYRPDGTGRWKIKARWRNHCWKMWHSMVVTWDGQALPCCFDKDARHAYGSLQEVPLKKLWNGSHAQTFRQQILNQRKAVDICRNCTEGLKVWA